MRLGGWWRLWIGLSALWVVGAVVLLYPNRPTPERVDRDVSSSCGIETPMTEQYARDALQMRKLLDDLVVADATKDEASARRLAAEIVRLRELWSKNTGTPVKYSRFTVVDPDGGEHTAIAPLPASNEEVMAQVDTDKRNVNNWASFSSYCVEQLQAHARGDLHRDRMKEWTGTIVLGSLSFPALLLALGAFVGWVWRGFRPKRVTPAKEIE